MSWTEHVCVWRTCVVVPRVGRRLVGCCSHPARSQPQCRNYSDLPGISSQLPLMTQGQPVIQIKYARGTESTSSCLYHTQNHESCPQEYIICHPRGWYTYIPSKLLTHYAFVYRINDESCFSYAYMMLFLHTMTAFHCVITVWFLALQVPEWILVISSLWPCDWPFSLRDHQLNDTLIRSRAYIPSTISISFLLY